MKRAPSPQKGEGPHFALAAIPFLKKLQFPKLNLSLAARPASFVGINIGSESVKVVQLRKERERAILETYGELQSARYFQKEAASAAGGFAGHSDQNVADMLTDVIREANVTAKRAVFSIPSTSSFITVIHLPLLSQSEIAAAIPFEVKKYVPIPTQEVVLDWQIIEEDAVEKRTDVLLVAVPRDIVAKCQRIGELMKIDVEAVEIESFSLIRSLLAADRGVTALIQWGAVATTVTVVDERRIRVSHNIGRGSREMTATLARSLGVTAERAESLKKEIGLSESPEHREIVEIITPMVDGILTDIERAVVAYNRGAKRKIDKIVLTGGGAGLIGLVGHVAKHFGLETSIGNPFARTVFPAFLQGTLKEIAPGFAVAVGLALRQISSD